MDARERQERRDERAWSALIDNRRMHIIFFPNGSIATVAAESIEEVLAAVIHHVPDAKEVAIFDGEIMTYCTFQDE